MQISDILSQIIGIKVKLHDNCLLGLVNSERPFTLSYFEDIKFKEDLEKNHNIVWVITKNELGVHTNKRKIIVEDPTWTFWTLHNYHAQLTLAKVRMANRIHPSAEVHPRAYVSDYGVEIGENTVIEPNVTIYDGVKIGRNCRVRANTAIGFDGFEKKMTSRGILSVVHDGRLIIEDDVEIGCLNSIAKGFSWRNTVVGSSTKTDSLVHIAHGVIIGAETRIAACAEVSGSVVIGDAVWVGPNSAITNGVTIGSNAYIGIGSVVTKNVPDSTKVAGNPARLLPG
jgi:UDP-3-O-[3-hydroxymyristoyl] glucosamine N-acyltransferase